MVTGGAQLAAEFLEGCLIPSCEKRRAVYERSGCPWLPTAEFSDWVAFSSVLTSDACAPSETRAELVNHVVKASPAGRSFPYYFDWEFGADELAADRGVEHLFISHSHDLRRVDVRRAPGTDVAEQIESVWGKLPRADAEHTDIPYDLDFAWVVQNAAIVAMFDDGQLTYSALW